MQSSVSLEETSDPRTEVGTIMTCRSLAMPDAWSEATFRDLSAGTFDDAYRSLGLTRVSFWLHRDPDAGIAMWEGADIDTLLERYSASSDPVLARWRGQLRVLSGPEVAENFWDATHDRLGSWMTGEEGVDSEVTVFRGAGHVEILRQMALDFEGDLSLKGLVDRIRRRQGFTRIEGWRQRTNDEEIFLLLLEAHDLADAQAQIAREDNEFDRRTMKLMRSAILETRSPPTSAKLVARWHA